MRIIQKSLILLFAALAGTPPARAASPAAIWFAPHTSHLSIPAPDFMNLFAPDASWRHAASHIKVFKTYGQFVARASDADVRTMIVWLQQHHMALALEYGFVDYTDKSLCDGENPACGHLESQGGETLAGVLGRIKSLGGDVRYIMMDEPIWFGHILSATQDPAAPHASIAALAKNVAKQVAIAHQYFPDVQIGDAEPVSPSVAPSDYVATIAQWAEAYKAASGRSLSFFIADVSWLDDRWRAQLKNVSQLIRSKNITFGIIYSGSPSDSTGTEWTTAAERHFAEVEADPAMLPDIAIIQSWDPEPAYALPETQPGTMTYLVNRYATAETVLNAARTSNGFAGTLISHGAPVTDASVDAYEIDDGTLNITTTPSLKNKIPANATKAVIGLRINVECGCNGNADIFLGPAKYTDETTKTVNTISMTQSSQRIVIPSGQHLMSNIANFTVVAGNDFSFSLPMQVPYGSRNTGYAAVFFLDAADKEIARFILPFQPGRRHIGPVITDSKGRFRISKPTPSSIVEFDFKETHNFRSSSMLSQ